MTITVLLADDQEMVRAGLRLIVDSQDDMTVIAEARNGVEALQLARLHHPDVAVLDIQMPKLDGVSVTEQLFTDRSWSGRVLILTTHGRDDYLFAAIRAGASGFLLKTSPPRLLPVAIREACAGETTLSSELTRRLIQRFAREAPTSGSSRPAGLATLTTREIEVLRYIARGQSNTEIAQALHIAESTVKTHIVHILEKLNLRDRTQAAVVAYESGLVHPSAPE